MLLTGLPLELKQVNIIITCLMIELVENNENEYTCILQTGLKDQNDFSI